MTKKIGDASYALTEEEKSRLRPFDEWTEYCSDQQIVFCVDADLNARKVAEWRLISDTEMHYTAYNRDGSINTHHVFKGDDILDNWNRYLVKPKEFDPSEYERQHILMLAQCVRDALRKSKSAIQIHYLRETAKRYIKHHSETPHRTELQALISAYMEIPEEYDLAQ